MRWLLIACAAAATATATAALVDLGTPAGIRIALGVPFLFAAPGYALQRALFPGRSGNWPQMTATMLGLSLIATILVTLVLNLLPWGLTSATWAVGIGSVTVIAAAVGSHRNPPGTAPAGSRPRIRDVSLLVLAGLVAAAAVILAFRPLGPPPSDHGYAELWLVHHRQTVHVGVISYEQTSTRFLVEVRNGRNLEYRDVIVLAPGQRWVRTLPANRRLLEATLWLRPGTGSPVRYREVRLAPAGQP